MIIAETMDNLAEYLKAVLENHSATHMDGERHIAVYAGYPPIRSTAAEADSFVYVLATKATDAEDGSTVEVEIGFSIYDNNPTSGGRNLFNCMEHVRSALLQRRTVANKHYLILPVTTKVTDAQNFPEWTGIITATYALAQMETEMIP